MHDARALTSVLLLTAAALAQSQWVQIPVTGPGPRNSTALAFDSARGVAVLYGGFGGGVLSDTWEWNGTAWNQRLASSPPGILNGHAMAYDSARGVVVLFGGARSGSLGVGETWEWNGASWTQRATTGPVGRVNHQLCFDAARGVTVLFGGHVDYNAGPDLGDTWEWNGSAWTQRSSTGPGARTYHAMAYDDARGRTVLFGGRIGINPVADTWEWNGTSWSQRSPATSPPARIDHEMTFDAVRRRTIVFSGFNAPADTWEWDGVNWLQRTPATDPGNRYAFGFCYDSVRHRALLFGGYRGGQLADTWAYAEVVPAQYQVAGAGCLGLGGVPAIAAVPGSLPWLGETFAAQATNLSQNGLTWGILGLSDQQWGAIPLPVDLGVIGMTNCRLYASIDVVIGLTNSLGNAGWSLPIPNVPNFVGARFHQQVLNVSTGSNALGLTTSNYGSATIGAR